MYVQSSGYDRLAIHVLGSNLASFKRVALNDIVYYHLPDVSFMTFGVSETVRSRKRLET